MVRLEGGGDAEQWPLGVERVEATDGRVAPFMNLKERDLAALGDYFILEGENSIFNLVAHGRVPLISVCLSAKRVGAMRGLIGELARRQVPVYALDQATLNAVVGFDFHRGVLGLGRKLAPRPAVLLLAPLARETLSIIILAEKVNNLDNTGALFRNAAAFGAGAVLLDAQSSDPYYRKAIRVSGGHALAVPFTRMGTIQQNILAAQQAGFCVVAMVTPHARPDLPPPVEIARWRSHHDRPRSVVLEMNLSTQAIAVLVGAEGPGLSDEAQALADVRCTIPMTIDSVNVATACAIALHEFTAPRKRPDHDASTRTMAATALVAATLGAMTLALARRPPT